MVGHLLSPLVTLDALTVIASVELLLVVQEKLSTLPFAPLALFAGEVGLTVSGNVTDAEYGASPDRVSTIV